MKEVVINYLSQLYFEDWIGKFELALIVTIIVWSALCWLNYSRNDIK